MFRGKISSNHFVDTGIPVLHSSAAYVCSKYWEAGVRFIEEQKGLCSLPFVQNNDILINRVGRSAGYWCIYRGEDTIISDCLIVVRSEQTLNMIKIFKKHSNEGRLLHLVKGLTTKYISQKDFAAWLNSNI